MKGGAENREGRGPDLGLPSPAWSAQRGGGSGEDWVGSRPTRGEPPGPRFLPAQLTPFNCASFCGVVDLFVLDPDPLPPVSEASVLGFPRY